MDEAGQQALRGIADNVDAVAQRLGLDKNEVIRMLSSDGSSSSNSENVAPTAVVTPEHPGPMPQPGIAAPFVPPLPPSIAPHGLSYQPGVGQHMPPQPPCVSPHAIVHQHSRPGAPWIPQDANRPIAAVGPSKSSANDPGSSSRVIARIIGVSGVVVTLVGVVFLLVMAARSGLLSPSIRVAGGVVLAIILTCCGLFLSAKPDNRVGAVTLTATGMSTAYLCIVACTSIYDWLPAVDGLVMTGVTAGGGLAWAWHWKSEALGLLVVVPVFLLSGFIAFDLDHLLAFMLVMLLVTFPAQLGRDWPYLLIARTLAVWIPLNIGMFVNSAIRIFYKDPGNNDVIITAALVLMVVSVGSAVFLYRSRPYPTRTSQGIILGVGASALIPILFVGSACGLWWAGSCALVSAGIYLASSFAPVQPAYAKQTWAILALVMALVGIGQVAAALVLNPVLLAGPIFIAIGICVMVLAPLDWLRYVGGGICACGAFVVFLLGNGLYSLLVPQDLGAWSAVSVIAGYSLIACAVAVGMVRLVSIPRLLELPFLLIFPTVAVAFSLTQIIVVCGSVVYGDTGFYTGHVIATVTYVVLAGSMLWYSSRPSATPVLQKICAAGGFTTVIFALIKLFFYDLAAIDGFLRVSAFIVVGLLLLGTGAVYGHARTRRTGPSTHPAHAPAVLGSAAPAPAVPAQNPVQDGRRRW